MDIILHLGAHRTGSTTFQDALRRGQGDLSDANVGFWGPRRTRTGLFAGAMPLPGDSNPAKSHKRARGRVQLRLHEARAAGTKTLILSDENMLGSVRANIRKRSLYPDVGERMARYGALFDGEITRIIMNIRAQDLWWSSAISYGIGRGHPVPDRRALAAIAASPRQWRDVIADVACALPKAELCVLPFERFAARPQAVLTAGAECDVTLRSKAGWLNRAPDASDLRALLSERGDAPEKITDTQGRWQPFDVAQAAALRENYADDLHWLAAGADGLATLTQDPDQTRAGQTSPSDPHTRGHDDDEQKGRLAHSG